MRGNPRRYLLAFCAAIALSLASAPASPGRYPADVFGGDATCTVQPSAGNVRLCSGQTTHLRRHRDRRSNVILPPAPVSGPDGPYPTIATFSWLGRVKDRRRLADPGLGDRRLRRLQHERPRLGRLLWSNRSRTGSTPPSAGRATTI